MEMTITANMSVAKRKFLNDDESVAFIVYAWGVLYGFEDEDEKILENKFIRDTLKRVEGQEVFSLALDALNDFREQWFHALEFFEGKYKDSLDEAHKNLKSPVKGIRASNAKELIQMSNVALICGVMLQCVEHVLGSDAQYLNEIIDSGLLHAVHKGFQEDYMKEGYYFNKKKEAILEKLKSLPTPVRMATCM
jgi:hypothetical protein